MVHEDVESGVSSAREIGLHVTDGKRMHIGEGLLPVSCSHELHPVVYMRCAKRERRDSYCCARSEPPREKYLLTPIQQASVMAVLRGCGALLLS